MKKIKVVITGGLGFIFSHVTEFFVKKGYEVVVIDNCQAGSHPEIVDGSFKHIKKDFAAPDAWRLIVREKPDWIIHAASITDVDTSILEPEQVMVNNVMCNINAFHAARQLPHLKKMLYVNTDEVYGECEYRKTENDILFPRNPYSCSKATGSLMRYAYDSTYSSMLDKTAEIRMCNIFGPRQDVRKIMPQIIKSIRTGYSIPLHFGGEGYREYLYVKNVPQIVEKIMLSKKGARTYNITTNTGFTVKELFRTVEHLTGKKVSSHDGNRPGHDRAYRMDNSRILDAFNWKPKYNFDQGMIDYLKHEKVI